MTEKIQEAADILVEMMDGRRPEVIGAYLKRIKDVEHSCDDTDAQAHDQAQQILYHAI